MTASPPAVRPFDSIYRHGFARVFVAVPEVALADPATAPERYDAEVGARFDAFLRTGRRFSLLIGHPWILRSGLRLAVGTDAIAKVTLQVMGNLVDGDTPGMPGRVFRAADKTLGLAEPVLKKTRAAA